MLWSAGLAPARAADFPVGVTRLAFEDPSRPRWEGAGPRPLDTVLWYPAAAGAKERDWTAGPFDAGRVAADAPPAPGRWPVVLLSHGTGGSAPSLGWLARALAAHGWLVLAVNHHGNTGAEPHYQLPAFLAWWDRPRDLTLALDRLLADPRWGPRADAGRVGAAGFSAGGYSALALAGVRLDEARWQAWCQAQPQDTLCHLPPEAPAGWNRAAVDDAMAHDPALRAALARMGDDYRDARVRAVFAIAPVIGPVATPASLAAVRLPVALVAGGADDQATPARQVQPYAGGIAGASLSVLPGATHYVFLAPCTALGRWLAPQAICRDPAGVDRAALHAQVAAQALDFFARHLGP